MNWKEFLKEKRNKIEFVVTLLFLAVVLASLANFLNFAEARQGVVLPDPILNLFNPIDLTWLIFALIYISLVVAIATLIKNPKTIDICNTALLFNGGSKNSGNVFASFRTTGKDDNS